MKNILRFFLCAGLIFAVTACGIHAFAGSVDEIERQQEETKAQADKLKREQEQERQKAQELEKAKKDLESALGEMNSELQILSNSVAELEDEIAAITKKTIQLQKELDKAQATASEQYESMKLRIQYMYENSNTGTIVLLLESGNLSEFLSRVEYVSQISDYDRDKLAAYENTIEQIAADQRDLEEQQSLLEARQTELAGRQKELMAGIESTQAKLDDAAADADAQKKVLQRLEGQIAAMDAYEATLEQQKAEAAASSQSQQKEQIEKEEDEVKDKDTSGNYSSADQRLLAALIYCEAGGESYTAQVAVGTVVMNRIASSYFPNTLTGVIYQSRQFTPASSGRLALALENNLATDSCRRAAKTVLAGERSGNWLYFCVNNGNIRGTVIGRQVFY